MKMDYVYCQTICIDGDHIPTAEELQEAAGIEELPTVVLTPVAVITATVETELTEGQKTSLDAYLLARNWVFVS
jgi:hypothetical protein